VLVGSGIHAENLISVSLRVLPLVVSQLDLLLGLYVSFDDAAVLAGSEEVLAVVIQGEAGDASAVAAVGEGGDVGRGGRSQASGHLGLLLALPAEKPLVDLVSDGLED